MPERERFSEESGAERRLRLARLREQPLEPMCVDALRIDRQPISRRLRHDDVAAERLPQRVDGVLERARRRRRRAVAPEVEDQAVGRDDLARAECERRHQRPLLAPRQVQDVLALAHLERAEEADLHEAVVTPAQPLSK